MKLQCSSSWFITRSCSQGEGRPISKWASHWQFIPFKTCTSRFLFTCTIEMLMAHIRAIRKDKLVGFTMNIKCKWSHWAELLWGFAFAVSCHVYFLALTFLIYEFWQLCFFYLHFHTDKPSVSWEAGCVCVRKKGKNIININVTKYPHPGPHTKINIHTARFTSVPHLNLFQ